MNLCIIDKLTDQRRIELAALSRKHRPNIKQRREFAELKRRRQARHE